MDNVFNVRKSDTVVSPSGVKFGILSLKGSHQALITNQNDAKRRKGFEELLFDCIEFIGSKQKNELNMNHIKKLLEVDRKFLLFEIRQLSNKRNPKFVFDYEFPTEGGKKLRERKTVDFTTENFPVTPFVWMREKMIEDWKELTGRTEDPDGDELREIFENEFPVMYEDYKDMLDEHYMNEFKLPECGVTVWWSLQTAEDTMAKERITDPERINSHTMIAMHNPLYISSAAKDAGKDTKQPVPLDQLDYLDIEGLRGEILRVEGSVDSTVVVQYKDDQRKQQQLDLVAMPAFFFPSLIG